MNYDFGADKEKILRGKKIWDAMSREYRFDSKNVVLVLAGDNKKLDLFALDYLQTFVSRKKANRAEILLTDESYVADYLQRKNFLFPVNERKSRREDLSLLYDYYCFAFNLDNIAFTFLNHCYYNLMGRILNETDITEEEAVCLGVYWLRELQEKKVNV